MTHHLSLVPAQPSTMANTPDFLLSYVCSNYWQYMELFAAGHVEHALNLLVGDLEASGVSATKLQVVTALVQLQRSGALESNMAAPLYLLPFTLVCKGCGGGLPADNHTHLVQCLDVEGWRPAVLMKATCPECGYRYGYDTFTLAETEEEWRISNERPYLAVSHQFVISRRVLHNVETRIVLQHATFESEALVLGIGSRQLKQAVFLNWVMRHQRETLGYHVFCMSDTMVQEAVNHICREGLPSRLHCCSLVGHVHIPQQHMSDGQQERLLRRMDNVLVIDGHEKLNRRVCQYRNGQRELHPQSLVQTSVQCTGVPGPMLLLNLRPPIHSHTSPQS